MRTGILVAVIAVFGVACYSSAPSDRYYRRGDNVPVAATPNGFDAYTTNGDYVRIQQERDGDLVIVEPESMRGEHVAVISNDGANGAPLVTTDVTNGGWRARRPVGSAGDRPGP